MILADHETQVDLLNNEAIAKTITQLIAQRKKKAITIGIHGDWGAGKSSLLEMIEIQHLGQTDILCLKFNGWRFQGFEDAKIALMEGIVQEMVARKPGDTIKQQAQKVFSRIDWLKVAKKAGGLAFSIATGIPLADQLQQARSTLQNLLEDPMKFLTKDNLEKLATETLGLLKEEPPSNVPEQVAEFQKAFKDLLEAAQISQLIVLIDDLDRCLPDTAIETLEAVRLFMFTDHTAFVVAADEGMIEYAVRKHFPDLPESTTSVSYARNYLEKLIQVPFRIPALGEFETHIYVTLLLVGSILGEDQPTFNSLLKVARERLQTPWMWQPLTYQDLQDVPSHQTIKVQEMITLSEQIVPMLAGGTWGNPRQIKRFLNTLLLRHETAKARGFGDSVQLPVLAKLMLAERFLDEVYQTIEQQAPLDPAGHCTDLHLLETSLEDPTSPVESENTSVALKKWQDDTATKKWAQLQPPIGNHDLRPYLFIAKDRKDYFSAVSALGSLRDIANKLMGSRMQVAALTPQLTTLKPLEAEKLCGQLRTRIMQTNRFDNLPDGVPGMIALIRAHPTHLPLQQHLLDFLSALPADQVGAWVARGWEEVITDSHCIQRYDQLCLQWEQTGGPLLKAALGSRTFARRRN